MASRNTPGTAGSRMTKEQRREAAREAALRLREEEARRSKRNVIWVVTGVAVVLAIVVGAIWYIVSSSNKSDAGGNGSTSTAQYEDFAFGEKKFSTDLPKNVNEYGGISVGKELAAGTKNKDVPEVSIYFDYLCKFCNQLESDFGQYLTQLAQDGKITLTYYPVSILNQEFSTMGVMADYYIAENAPEQFTTFHNMVFSDLSEPVFESSDPVAPTFDDLVAVAKKAGVPEDVISGMEKAISSGSMDSLVTDGAKQFTSNGLTGTPAVIIDGKKVANWPTALETAINEAATARSTK